MVSRVSRIYHAPLPQLKFLMCKCKWKSDTPAPGQRPFGKPGIFGLLLQQAIPCDERVGALEKLHNLAGGDS